MAEGGWVVLGTAIGAIGSILTTWLNSHLGKKPSKYEKAAQKLLKEMLGKGPSWRRLITLSNVIGAEDERTKEFLLAIGARASESNPGLWGLVSRNPLPDHETSN